MGPSLQLGRIFGVPVEVNISWILVFLLLTYLLAGEFEDARLRWPMAQRWSVAMIIVVLFFLSVLLHELSHSVMALSKGIPVRGITLFIFGGVSRLDKEPERPLIEFMVAAVGPLMSIALAAVLGGIWFLMGRGDSPVEVVLVLLMWTNLSLGVFNLVPGYPLDGGRLLRAGIWGLTGNHRKATRISSGMGLLVGGGMLLGGISLAVFLEPVDGAWLAIVGAFLFSMAKSSFPK
ncbi:MAG: site-2 protease family protein [Dehalococcoidia bacterium]|nr:site-2 protease family protein [Dehalococcoidia bacterium]